MYENEWMYKNCVGQKKNVQDWGKKYMRKDVFLQLWYIYVTTNFIIIIISIK